MSNNKEGGKSTSGQQQPGEGIRNLQTSNVFRTLNFELYTKPNKVVMALGITAFAGCVGYIAYMNHQWKEAKVVTALNDKDELILVKKKSQWD